MRVPADRFLEVYRSREEVGRTVRRYIQTNLSMVMQTVACNRLHSVEQRAARWLLQVFDRAETEELNLTQEFLSHMLGVRRASVTEVARRLQAEGSIDYRRGRVRVVDVAKLRGRTCECYGVISDEFARLLPMPEPPARVTALPERAVG